ncbi:MAG TPA: esterase-like activity of phytase family protein [Hyphomicrobiaceae bacterium]|nr:esterase-like activity of phytase family protein [Hyphomicrobiaceae bacterium]
MNSLGRLAIAVAPLGLLLALFWIGTARAQQADRPLTATTLDVVTLDPERSPLSELREISGLAWDGDTKRLHAVSDGRRLLQLSLSGLPDKIGTMTVLARSHLTLAGGARSRKGDLNPEGLALVPVAERVTAAAELLVVSEAPPRLVVVDLNGAMLREVELPAALASIANLSAPKNGLESVTILPGMGYLTAPERPLRDHDRSRHVIFSSHGPRLHYTTEALGKTSIKAMDSLGTDRIVILERTRSNEGLIVPYLRVIEPRRCTQEAPCPGRVAKVTVPGITDADFEAIAHLGGDRFLIASDDRIAGRFRTVFALIAVAGLD